MAIGLGSLNKKAKKADKSAKVQPKADNDAADVLKKMEAKSDGDSCMFC